MKYRTAPPAQNLATLTCEAGHSYVAPVVDPYPCWCGALPAKVVPAKPELFRGPR